MTFPFENTVLNVAYGIIDTGKRFSLEKTARALVPAIAFTYTLGVFAGDFFHRVRHTMENHLVLDHD